MHADVCVESERRKKDGKESGSGEDGDKAEGMGCCLKNMKNIQYMRENRSKWIHEGRNRADTHAQGHEEEVRPAVTLVPFGPPCNVDVLKPIWRIAAARGMSYGRGRRTTDVHSRSAFCKGLDRNAAKVSFADVSSGAYALTAIMGVFAFLPFVLLMYFAALSPSTATTISHAFVQHY